MVLELLVRHVVVIDLDIFNLRIERHFSGINCCSCSRRFAESQGRQNEILFLCQALDLIIFAYDISIDFIDKVLWRPLYHVCVISVVQLEAEVKVPLVVKRFFAHSRDEGRVVGGDDVDRVCVPEELFIEPVVEVIKIERRHRSPLRITFHAGLEATVLESLYCVQLCASVGFGGETSGTSSNGEHDSCCEVLHL